MRSSQVRPPRLDDVAQASGVHVSTVSRVVNGAGDVVVRPETRQRILEAARELGYRPNAMARGLKLSTAGALGVLVPSLRNPLWSEIIHGAVSRAWERDFVVLLAEDTGEDSVQEAHERLVAEGRIDGLLVLSARSGSPILERLARDRIPVVFANRGLQGSGRNVVMDEEATMILIADYLVSLGHSRVGHIDGPPDIDTAARRVAAFGQLAENRGIELLVEHTPFDEQGGLAAMELLLSRERRPSACVVASINQVIGAVRAVRERGIGVPEQLYLVSVDEEPLLDYLDVPVTGVELPLFELGIAAADALIEQIGGSPPRDIVLPTAPSLVRR
jgi:DNA-binding LacI/PurR family transcriptional regulator